VTAAERQANEEKEFTRVPAHVTFRSFYVDEGMEIRLVLPLNRNAMGRKKHRKSNINYGLRGQTASSIGNTILPWR
jgi:hypothetical protein